MATSPASKTKRSLTIHGSARFMAAVDVDRSRNRTDWGGDSFGCPGRAPRMNSGVVIEFSRKCAEGDGDVIRPGLLPINGPRHASLRAGYESRALINMIRSFVVLPHEFEWTTASHALDPPHRRSQPSRDLCRRTSFALRAAAWLFPRCHKARNSVEFNSFGRSGILPIP